MCENACFTAQSYGFYKCYQIKMSLKMLFLRFKPCLTFRYDKEKTKNLFTFLNLPLNFLPSGVF